MRRQACQESFVMPDRYTPIPDYFFDVVFPTLNGSEVKALLYILRHTYGYQKGQDTISYSQFLHGIMRRDGSRQDAGAGLSERALVRALAALETQGHIQRLSAVGRATYYRPIAPGNIRETPAAHPPKVPAHVPQPPENLAETRNTLQETSPKETKAAPPAMIALLLSLGISEADARLLAALVASKGYGVDFVQAWCADIKQRTDITRPIGFLRAMAKSGAWPATKTPPSFGGGFAWADYDAVRLRGDTVSFRNLTQYRQRRF